MSISATLSNAVSGLTAAARSAETVSNNVANALTEGYARREVALSARVVGGAGQGVRIDGIRRIVDAGLIADRRLAQASTGDRTLRAQALLRIERAIGSPEAGGSLTGRIARLDAALIEAATRPESDARLAGAVDAARALAGTLRAITEEIQALRSDADAGIAADVARLNAALEGVAELNGRIGSLTAIGRDSSGLMDERQRLIDSIAGLVPLREIDRGNGTVALYTAGGAALLDGTRPARLEFAATGTIVAEMTLASGALSGLAVNGRPADMGPGSMFAGGELAARFALRDSLAPAIQADLDALARDLIGRFAPPDSPDTTLAPGAPGLFTDAGGPFSPVAEPGLAGRIGLNALVDPAQGGAVRRLRDGLGAALPGPPGEGGLLSALSAALTAVRPTLSGSLAGGNRSLPVLAGQTQSAVAALRLSAEAEASFSAARFEGLRVLELEGGVDTDRELQDLLAIERAYGANARVIQAVDEMLRLLIGR